MIRPNPLASSIRSLIAGFTLTLAFAATVWADVPTKHFDIPSGDAAVTLKQFVDQSGEQVVYIVNNVRGVATNAVTGDFTARSALDRMLSGTALFAVQDEKTNAIVVNRTAPGPADDKSGPHDPPANASKPGDGGRHASDDGVTRLPSFTVNSRKDDSYVGKEALSTTRTGIALLDLPQTVKVINRQFIDDINPGLLIDTLKYVGGGQAGNINFADDRFTLRGFNSPANIGDFVDGFRAATDSNVDLALIDRLEIIKGPSAIFVANGPVGGVINKITKSPVDYELRTLKVQVGLFDANRVELDLGGPITADHRLLYRFTAAGQYADGYYDNTYSHRIVIGPALTYNFNSDAQLTFKYHYYSYHFSSYNGVPWDIRTGHRIAVGPKTTLSEDAPLNWRKDTIHRGELQFTKRFNPVVATRVAAFLSDDKAPRVESVDKPGAIPATWVNGMPLPRSTTVQDADRPRRQIQNDYVFTFHTGPASHRLLVGGEWSDAPDIVASFPGTSSDIDPFNPRFPGNVTVGTTPSGQTRTNNKQLKGFALETLGLFHDRLLLSYGQSRVRARTSSTNKLTGSSTPVLSLTQDLKQYGAVFKATDGVSLFYGYSENFAPNFLNGQVLPAQLGKQKEVGVKADILAGRLSFNVAHFDITQVNIPVPAFPQTTPPTFILVPGETSRGFDGDVAFAVNRNLDIVGTFAIIDARARSQANTAAPVIVNPVNNIAEHTYGLWTRYKVTKGDLAGFSVGIGASHLSPRAVTNNSNAVVYGWLAGFTIVDLVLGYERGPLKYALNVDNALNEKYDAAVRNESIIVPGMGTNVKLSVTWKF